MSSVFASRIQRPSDLSHGASRIQFSWMSCTVLSRHACVCRDTETSLTRPRKHGIATGRAGSELATTSDVSIGQRQHLKISNSQPWWHHQCPNPCTKRRSMKLTSTYTTKSFGNRCGNARIFGIHHGLHFIHCISVLDFSKNHHCVSLSP